MNRTELINAIAEKAGITKKEAGEALEALTDTIQRAVAKGERVAITGFGSFEKSDRPARDARNPATGAAIKVAATSVPKFRPGIAFKEKVADGGARQRAEQVTR